MDWVAVAINVLVGTLIPSIVLWIIGKKIQYDFEFWKLLIITGAASLTGQIPYGGMWISLPVYYGLFCFLTGINYIEAMWMSFLAFLVYAAVGFVLMMYAGSLFASSLESDSPEPVRAAAEQPAGNPSGLEEPASEEPAPPAIPADRSETTADRIGEKYRVNGIAKRGGRMIAIINDKIVSEGELLEDNLSVHRIEPSGVILRSADTSYRLPYGTAPASQ